MTNFERLLWIRERRWIGYGLAVILCVAGLITRLALRNVFPGAPFLTFLPAIIIATVCGGAAPGIFAIVLTGWMVNSFILLPAHYNLFWPNGWVLLLAFIVITGTMVLLVDISMKTSINLSRASALLRAANDGLELRIAERTAALMQAEEKLRQAQKMEAVGRLTGGIAHDFNNLLTGITGSLEMLQTRLAQGRLDDLPRYVAAARDSATRAAALTQRLLAFSRQQTLDPRAIDISALAGGLEDLIRRSIGPGVNLVLRPSATQAVTCADPNQLEHALLNLCINASDAMPEGGELRIMTAISPEEDHVMLSVQDTGTGMTPDVAERAFEPFFTTKPQGQGTGLGLSMIYGFVQQSGGDVRIATTAGAGTTVTLLLPRYHGAPASTAAPAPVQETRRLASAKQVLVVDDEPSLRLLVAEVLDDLGCQVLQAGDGPSGLHHLESTQPIDLLVTDLGLPGGMNGRQLADAARTLRPGLKTLFITGYATQSGPLPPNTEMLAKPFSLEVLAAKIEALLVG